MLTFLLHLLVLTLSVVPLLAWYRYLTFSAGILALSIAGFFAVGAYTSSVLSKLYGLPAVASFAIASVGCAILGLGVGVLLLTRLRHDFFALATLAFSQAAYIFIRTFAPGGSGGFAGIPPLFQPAANRMWLIDLSTAATFCIASMLILFWVEGSRFGRLVLASRDQPAAVEALGFKVTWIQGQVFGAAALVAAASGAFQAHYLRAVDPGLAGMPTAVILLTAMILARRHRVFGPVLGALFMTGTPEAIQFLFRLWFETSPWKLFPVMQLITGALVVSLSVIYFPRTLIGGRRAHA